MVYVHRRMKVSLASAGQDGGSIARFPSPGEFSFSGLRTTARIHKAGGMYQGTAEIMIYGLSFENMKALSTWGTMYHPSKNYKIVVEAGDDVNGMSVVFAGTVLQSWADFTNMPDVPFYMIAQGSTAPATVGTVDPNTSGGPTKVAPLMEKLAKGAGLNVEIAPGAQSKMLDGLYHWGSPWKQIKEMADAVGLEAFVDDGTLAVWPKDTPRAGDTLFVSPKTGLRDYPTFTEYGVLVKVEFTRAVKYGTQVQIESSLDPANGLWRILNIDYDLQAETPGGQWFVYIGCTALGAPVSILPDNTG